MKIEVDGGANVKCNTIPCQRFMTEFRCRDCPLLCISLEIQVNDPIDVKDFLNGTCEW